MSDYENKLFITFDIDWAADFILEYLLVKLEESNVKATFFVTHNTEVFQRLKSSQYEIALHPNYRGKDAISLDSVIADLKEIYPDAVGVRSHGLYFGSDYLQSWLKNGIKYDSNIFLPYESNVNAHDHCTGLTRIPYCWDDDAHLGYEYNFDWNRIDFESAGLKIFSFHPVHIYYNSNSHAYYNKIKEQNYPFRNEVEIAQKGIHSMFVALLDYIKNNNIETGVLKDIYEEMH